MLVVLFRCFMILLSLWFARYFHLLPWTIPVSLACTVVVPISLMALTLHRATKRGEKAALHKIRARLAGEGLVIPDPDQLAMNQRQIASAAAAHRAPRH